jgi:phosphoribosylanthranilate isomerase
MKYRTRIKMCGTTSLQDAQVAVDLGVDALGFIFAERSPRVIVPEAALEIVSNLPPFVDKIGVFVNKPQKEIEEIIHYLGLTGVQLHGDEDPGFCEGIARSVPSCSVLKAFRVGKHTQTGDIAPFNSVVKGFVLDSFVKNQEGGTGHTFDWDIIERLDLQKPFLLAGGLNPDNIVEAVGRISPYGVDVNSGIEDAPGRKNHELLRRFVANLVLMDS